MDRDGVLGGLRLNEVAAVAGVNRALVYRHFKTGKGLLRQALKWEVEQLYPDMKARQGRIPFVERRSLAAEDIIHHSRAPKLMMMLVLDDDPDVRVSPLAESSLQRLRDEAASGVLPSDAEIQGIHAFSVAAALGYAVLRQQLATELGVTVDELDRQVRVVREDALEGIANPRRPRAQRHDSSAGPSATSTKAVLEEA